MLPKDATIAQLVNDGLLRKSLDYVQGVLGNCYQQGQKHQRPLFEVRVRIGRTGDGTAPNYKIEFLTERDPNLLAQLANSPAGGLPAYSDVILDSEFRGSNHKPNPTGFAKGSWSSAPEDVTTLEALRDRLRVAVRKSW